MEDEKFEEADEDEPLEATLLPSEPAEEERREAVEDDARHEAEEPVPAAGGKTSLKNNNNARSQIDVTTLLPDFLRETFQITKQIFAPKLIFK